MGKDARSFSDAARDIVGKRGPAVMGHVDGLHAQDPHAVHQTRVASRRLRAALEGFDACFHGKRHRRLLRLVKATADDLGEARDLDVQIAYLRAYHATCPPSDRPGLESLIELLERERMLAQEKVLPAVERLEHERFAEQLERLVEDEG